jgi:hypothetical protein
LFSTKLTKCDKTGLNQEDVLVDGVNSLFVNSHLNINHVQGSVDKITKYVSFLTADVKNDVYSSMIKKTLIKNPVVISKNSVRLANDFVREQLRDNLLSVNQLKRKFIELFWQKVSECFVYIRKAHC